MKKFVPDYQNIIDAARNKKPQRVPLYEHTIALSIIEEIIGTKFANLYESKDYNDLKRFFNNYCDFFLKMGYDTVSFEVCIGPSMPGSGSLGGHKPGIINNRKDFEIYPWHEIEKSYFDSHSKHFEALREEMPEGMKAIGGPGNGIFECVQDVVGYESLCFIAADDPKLFEDLFCKIGEINYSIWNKFLKEFGDVYAVCRFGDDLGFKSSTLLPPEDIKSKIIPQYKKIIDLVHSFDKPFLLHSCGNIFNVMDDIINIAQIDAKHSNEDIIAPFSEWVDKYGSKIALFGGIDMNVLCQNTTKEIQKYTFDILNYCQCQNGIAFGSGNSIPDYVPIDGYLAMINTIRNYRGDFVSKNNL